MVGHNSVTRIDERQNVWITYSSTQEQAARQGQTGLHLEESKLGLYREACDGKCLGWARCLGLPAHYLM